jgi:hypothetical protein
VGALWILIPAPFVGYLIIDSFRKVFSDDETILKGIFREQPVTMLAASTALGSVAVWAVSEVVMRWL